ncbi:MAG: NAD-dependent epimerase/dehydratase family protein [Bacteroidetes bacterium]|nr:NAD-dependent epimerase/dehydratase family protein [Bacteroidota bacterium]
MNNSKLNGKVILLTGGAGFIGSHILEVLLEKECIVHIIDSLKTGPIENIPEHPNVHLHVGSVLDFNFLQSIKYIRFDMIFHLASVVGMKLALKHKNLTYETATQGTKNVLSIFKNIPAVLFSSSSVYGLTTRGACKENDIASDEELLEFDGGETGYSYGKKKMEEIGLAEASKGRKVLIIRPFNIVGTKQLHKFGMVVPRFIKQATENNKIQIYDDGKQVRSFSEVHTFLYCLFKIVENDAAWKNGENIFNIGYPRGCSINELAAAVINETNSEASIEHIPYDAVFPNHTDVKYRVPNTAHGEKYYGTIKWPTINDIIRQILISEKIQVPCKVNL